MKNLIHKTLIPIYNEMLYVAFERQAAFNHFGLSDKDRELHGQCNGLAFEGSDHKDHRVFAMFIEKRGGSIDASTVAHECFHIADMILEVKGMQYKEESGNEHVAYLIGYLVDKVFDCLELDNQYQQTKLEK